MKWKSAVGDVSDETLMAFADGELSPTEHARIEAMIAGRPDLQQRLSVFAATGRQLSAGFLGVLNEPVPQHLVDLVMKRDREPAQRNALGGTDRAAANLWGVWDRLARALPVAFPGLPTALGFAAVLLIGVGAGTYLSRSGGRDAARRLPVIALADGTLVARGRLAQVLETALSGVDHVLDATTAAQTSAKVRIRVTFGSNEGFCRLYEVAPRQGLGASAVACRSDDGLWRLRAYVATPAGMSSGAGIRPAGRNGARLIEETIDSLIVGDALGTDDEAAAIARGWQTSAPRR